MDTSPGGKWLVRKDGLGRPSWGDVGAARALFQAPLSFLCAVQSGAAVPHTKLPTLSGSGS